MGAPTTSIPLDRHSIKMPPDALLLCPYNGSHPLSSEKLLPAADGSYSVDPQLVNAKRIQDCGLLNPKQGALITHPLKSQGEEGTEILEVAQVVYNLKETYFFFLDTMGKFHIRTGIIYPRPLRAQSRNNSSMKEDRWM